MIPVRVAPGYVAWTYGLQWCGILDLTQKGTVRYGTPSVPGQA